MIRKQANFYGVTIKTPTSKIKITCRSMEDLEVAVIQHIKATKIIDNKKKSDAVEDNCRTNLENKKSDFKRFRTKNSYIKTQTKANNKIYTTAPLSKKFYREADFDNKIMIIEAANKEVVIKEEAKEAGQNIEEEIEVKKGEETDNDDHLTYKQQNTSDFSDLPCKITKEPGEEANKDNTSGEVENSNERPKIISTKAEKEYEKANAKIDLLLESFEKLNNKALRRKAKEDDEQEDQRMDEEDEGGKTRSTPATLTRKGDVDKDKLNSASTPTKKKKTKRRTNPPPTSELV